MTDNLVQNTTQGWTTIYDHPGKVQSKFLTVDGYRTHYRETGSAASHPLVLVHGANIQVGLGSDRWFPNLIPLGERFHVFAIDELGGGDTEPPRDIDDIGHIRVRAEHVLAFIEALDVGPVHLLGQSQGAWIAAYVALRRPDLVAELVLVDSASLALPGGGVGSKGVDTKYSDAFVPGTMVRSGLEMSREGIRRWLSTMTYDASILPDSFLDRCVELGTKWMPIWEKPWMKFWSDGGRRNVEQYEVDGMHISEHMDQLTKQPLIIWGNNSVKGLDNGVSLYKRMKGAEFYVFDKANHFLWIDRWRDFNSLVSWFLTRND
ncbi:alpha/beta fold hydrolase [Rhizobium leguminosarum]|uniref:Alpha/beta fold hydrolase n=1 Tax=Rhizobium ruizarguesonis TaxID=2081791 RepID=A0AAE4YV06_9HYPH|nr:alpha/beta hydrolase [Rhizobium ruizarguesonis]MCB2404475.1 alpha/beta hydrolase [Rhizobium ruizarguesonis]NEI51737.1 alpha/beta fold hydrolase [Rhizobium ruizarguesonis]TBD11465.1 alpha/beta hydrolase [Rhizobium ruizarguesonis]